MDLTYLEQELILKTIQLNIF